MYHNIANFPFSSHISLLLTNKPIGDYKLNEASLQKVCQMRATCWNYNHSGEKEKITLSAILFQLGFSSLVLSSTASSTSRAGLRCIDVGSPSPAPSPPSNGLTHWAADAGTTHLPSTIQYAAHGALLLAIDIAVYLQCCLIKWILERNVLESMSELFGCAIYLKGTYMQQQFPLIIWPCHLAWAYLIYLMYLFFFFQ